MNKKQIEIYTDGACSGNPGPGGWGVLLRYGKHEKRLYGGEWDTTNNRMELMAAIQGLAAVKEPCIVRVITDSQYVKKGITEWLVGWKKKGWKTAGNKPVKNQDLWERLDLEVQNHDIQWEWVKGHSDHPENDIADLLARTAIEELIAKGK